MQFRRAGSAAPAEVTDLSPLPVELIPRSYGGDDEGYPVAPEQIVTTGSTVTRVASLDTTAQLLAANVYRAGLLVHNNSSAVLYLKYGSTVDIAGGNESYTVSIAAGAMWTMPEPPYTGRIDAIWAAANGFAMCTETT